VKAQIVFARVGEESRERYLAAWTEWTGTLFTMGIRAQLLEADERRGEFTEITWFEDGQEAALADDRVVRAGDALGTAADERTGALRLHALVS
jgi:hypothetical protein